MPSAGGEQVEVVAEELPHLLVVEAVQGGLEQLAGEVEGDGGEGLAAAGGQDGAPVPGGAVYLGEERGLPYARVAPVDEDAAASGASGSGAGDEFVDGVGGRGELRAAFEQPAPLRVGDVRRERRCGRRLFGFRRHR
ncbi:hypothetical protein EDD98_4606 [Streptomyces sp. PanSC19]|nr:hypothetical protein EDD98_4606 [Streptomyces sp. PanSC19]